MVISSAGADASTTAANLSFVLKNPATGSAIVTLNASGLKSAASATSAALTGAVTTDAIYVKFHSEELNREVEADDVGGVPPSLSNKKLSIPGGYVVLEEKIETLSSITVNAAHIVFNDASTGTHVDVVIGSAAAGR